MSIATETSYTLRRAKEEDYDFLFALHRATMRPYVEATWGWHDDWQEEYFRRKFDARKRQIIQVNGRDIGVLVVEQLSDELYLGLIEITPVYQGRGIGSAVVGELKRRAEAQHMALTLHVLRTNTAARSLYERLGFIVIEDGPERIKMAWSPEN